MSDDLGGLIVVSNEVGCRGWKGKFNGLMGNEGDFSSMENQLNSDNEFILGTNSTIYPPF